jgi:hypothetical protein
MTFSDRDPRTGDPDSVGQLLSPDEETTLNEDMFAAVVHPVDGEEFGDPNDPGEPTVAFASDIVRETCRNDEMIEAAQVRIGNMLREVVMKDAGLASLRLDFIRDCTEAEIVRLEAFIRDKGGRLTRRDLSDEIQKLVKGLSERN